RLLRELDATGGVRRRARDEHGLAGGAAYGRRPPRTARFQADGGVESGHDPVGRRRGGRRGGQPGPRGAGVLPESARVTALALNACIALLPVLLFLAMLVLMDTFKLAHWTTIITAIVWGVIAALVCDAAYDALARLPWLSDSTLVRYVAPVLE